LGLLDMFRRKESHRDPRLQYTDGKKWDVKEIRLPPRDDRGRFIPQEEYDRQQAKKAAQKKEDALVRQKSEWGINPSSSEVLRMVAT